MAGERGIIQEIEKKRKQILALGPREFPMEVNLQYKCGEIRHIVAMHAGAQLWDSLDMEDTLIRGSFGHTVGVFPIAGGKALVAQFFDPIKIGIIDGFHDEASIREGLRKLTGARQWDWKG